MLFRIFIPLYVVLILGLGIVVITGCLSCFVCRGSYRIQRAFYSGECAGCYVGVDFGGFGAFVAEEFLYVSYVYSVFKEVGGEAVSEGVDCCWFLYACFFEGCFEYGLCCSG